MAAKEKKTTIRERKLAQQDAQLYFSEAERQAIIDTVASKLEPAQVKIYFYQCQALGLNPLLSEITAIVYKGREGSKMSIQVMRDGFLKIAHKSGKFAGIESGTKGAGADLIGWCKVYHKDFKYPVSQEADFSEYAVLERGGKPTLWKSKPKTMIKKVAESMALRKAFNVSGVYAPEEMEAEIVKTEPKQIEISNPDKPASAEQVATLMALTKNIEKDELPMILQKKKVSITRKEAADLISELSAKK